MNTRKSLFPLLLVVGSLCINAQNLDRFPVISDSSHLATAEYQTGNKYQKDAILFMEMVANTHPYYVKAERRAEWFDKKKNLLRQCKGFMSDEDFADALVALLGSLHDKHTDLTTISRMRERKPVPTSTTYIPDKAVFEREKALKALLNEENADAGSIKTAIMDLASAKYDSIM